ncbi:MAG TPA: class F sortase [Ktedonobacterales bacterium]|jgi:hypothetical protein|nr:class F sortase [Ktedonobacterales bacterium]
MRSRRLLLAVALVVALLAICVGVLWDVHASTAPTRAANAAPTATAHVTTTVTPWTDQRATLFARYAPLRLSIPSINLDVAIIGVGVTSAGAMDAPRCNSNSDPICNQVYWFNGGYLPGEMGNAVIAGHVNRPDLSPAPFWNLHLVKKGDTIIVQPLTGRPLVFVVTSVTWISAYAQGSNNPTLDAVFGPAATRNLNLLTCIGDWDGHTFDHRLLVQAQLQGPAPFAQP